MFHPKTHEFGNVLMGFLFKRGDQVIKIKSSAAAGIQHVAEGRAENLLTIAILQAVEKQNAFRAQNVVGLWLTCG